ncbi:hypothetical protein FACS189418_1250 [Clostridia bacterium]|nr:hypothetical protein FACS189418_1250 [Clostridia bacterium]
MALSLATKNEIENNSQKSFFPPSTQNPWYVKYMNYLYQKGLWDIKLSKPKIKEAEGYFTYQELAYLVQNIGISHPITKFMKTIFLPEYEQKYVPGNVWWEVYYILIQDSPVRDTIHQKEILLYGTAANLEDVAPGQLYTEREVLNFEGMDLDHYLDQKVEVLVQDKEILALFAILDQHISYENVWITENTNKSITVFFNHHIRTFPSNSLNQDYKETLADLQLENGKIISLNLKKDTIKGKVLLVDETGIEIEGYGYIPFSEQFHVYRTYGKLQEQQLHNIFVGYSVQEFIVADGKLCGGITQQEVDAQTIRVLLSTSKFKSIFHSTVQITANEDFMLSYGEQTDQYTANSSVLLDQNNPAFALGRIKIEAKNGGEVQVSSISRTLGTPSYEGVLEVSLHEQGILVVNELPVESYLKKVVPSEMPISYGLEALKAQAVCARSYVYQQIQANSYSSLGAHVDDSTKFQVYNNIARNALSDQAIEETSKEVLIYNSEVVRAYYFASSPGVTTNTGIWGNNPDVYPYLSGAILTSANIDIDLSNEKNFLDFIKNPAYVSFDQKSEWYRWNTYLSLDTLENKISNIGKIRSLEITKRGKNGIVSQILVHGEKKDYVINSQGEVRSFLGNVHSVIHTNDQATRSGWSTLPSAFISLEAHYQENEIVGYQIYGGGFGHGVGMSQTAASYMGNMGMDYRTILRFFYEGTEISSMQ